MITDSLGLRSHQISLHINRGQRAFNELLKTCLAHNELTIPQWNVLGELYTSGELRPRDIAQQIGVKQPFMTTILANLEQQGYIVSAPIPDDERSKSIYLSEKGTQKVEAVEAKLVICLEEQLGSLEQERLSTYFAVCEYMARNVKHH